MHNVKLYLLIVLAGLICGCNGVEAQDAKINGKLLSSDFAKGTGGWNVEYGGQWKVVDGAYQGKDRSAWAGDKEWTDYRITFKTRYMGTDQEGQVWFSFRYHDEWNRYALRTELLYYGYLGSLFVSAVLFVNVIDRLLTYVDYAYRPVE